MNGIVGMDYGKRFMGNKKYKIGVSTKNRFYSKVLLPNENDCMLWIGSLTIKGYGNFLGIKTHKNGEYFYKLAHRYSYFLHFGIHPRELYVLHKCDKPACVAPDHLFLGTHLDNMKDMILKGRLNNPKGNNAHNVFLTETDVVKIKKKLLQGETHISIAEQYGVDKTTITAINLKKNWKHVK